MNTRHLKTYVEENEDLFVDPTVSEEMSLYCDHNEDSEFQPIQETTYLVKVSREKRKYDNRKCVRCDKRIDFGFSRFHVSRVKQHDIHGEHCVIFCISCFEYILFKLFDDLFSYSLDSEIREYLKRFFRKKITQFKISES